MATSTSSDGATDDRLPIVSANVSHVGSNAGEGAATTQPPPASPPVCATVEPLHVRLAFDASTVPDDGDELLAGLPTTSEDVMHASAATAEIRARRLRR